MAAFDRQAGVAAFAVGMSVSDTRALRPHEVLLGTGQKRLAFGQPNAAGHGLVDTVAALSTEASRLAP